MIGYTSIGQPGTKELTVCQIPAHMQLDGCFPTSQTPTAPLPAICQFFGQCHATPLFEHDAAEAVQQFQGHWLLGMYEDADHFFQYRMQEPRTGLIKAIMDRCITHIHFSDSRC